MKPSDTRFATIAAIEISSKIIYTLLVIVFLLFAFVIGLQGINIDNVWHDEIISIQEMGAFQPSYHPLMTIEMMRQSSPDAVPLWYWITRAWVAFAGWSHFSLRLVSTLAGTMMIAMMYRLGAYFYGRPAGLTAAGFMASCGLVLWYFHEARPNALMMLFAVMHTWFYLRMVVRQRRSLRTRLLFAATAIALIYTHWLGAVLFAGLGLHLLVFVPNSRRKVDVLFAWGLCALIILPFVLIPKSFGARIPSELPGLPNPLTLARFTIPFVNELQILWAPLVLSLVYSVWNQRKPLHVQMIFIAAVMSIALIAVDWVYKPVPWMHPRAYLVLWIPFSLIFAVSITSFPRWKVFTFLIMLAFIVSGLYWTHSDLKDRYFLSASRKGFPNLQQFVFHLRDKVGRYDFLIGFAPSETINGSVLDYYLGLQAGIDGAFIATSRHGDNLAKHLDAIVSDHPYVLLAHDPQLKPSNLEDTRMVLARSLVPCDTIVNEPHLHIQRHVPPSLGCEHRPAPVAYDNGISILDRAARYDPLAETLSVFAWWDVPEKDMLREYNVSLQVITPDGRNVRQIDRHLNDGLQPWHVIDLSTSGLPSLDYRLVLILYGRYSGTRVSGAEPDSGHSEAVLTLLEFTID